MRAKMPVFWHKGKHQSARRFPACAKEHDSAAQQEEGQGKPPQSVACRPGNCANGNPEAEQAGCNQSTSIKGEGKKAKPDKRQQ